MDKENNKSQEQLLNPKFGLNTDTPDVKGFLKWLFDPEVTEAFKKLEAEEREANEN